MTAGQAEPLATAHSVARFAGLLADRSRAVMCMAMLDGRAWTAKELAALAGVGASTASEHLSLLVSEGILTDQRQGRHRYVRLAGPEIAQLLEDLGAVVGERPRPHSLRTAHRAGRLAQARTCYDHLAGRLGVALYDALVDGDLLSLRNGLSLTSAGKSWFRAFAGSDVVAPARSRPLVRTCLDWTERRTHLGGALGAVVRAQLLERRWITGSDAHRAVLVTTAGRTGLHELLGVELDE